MSSLFNLLTSDSIPDPSSATDCITLEEVAPRSSSLDGAVTIEFTSSPSRWYSPSDSYLVIGCNVFSTLTTSVAGIDQFAWQAPPFSDEDGAVFAKDAGAAFFSTVSLQVNGVLMGTISNPAQIGGVLSFTEITNDYAETVGSGELLQTNATQRARNTFGVTGSSGAQRSAFEIIYRSPLGFLRTMKAFPGARITQTFNVTPEYGSRVLTRIVDTETLTIQGKDVAAPTAATDHKVQLT